MEAGLCGPAGAFLPLKVAGRWQRAGRRTEPGRRSPPPRLAGGYRTAAAVRVTPRRSCASSHAIMKVGEDAVGEAGWAAATALSLLVAAAARGEERRSARVVLVAPLVALQLAWPLRFDRYDGTEFLARAVVATNFAWWANTKLLLLCRGAGPLAEADLSLGGFAARLILPAHPRAVAEGDRRRLVVRLACGAAVKVALLRVLVKALVAYPGMPQPLMDVLYAFGIYMFVGSGMDGSSAVLAAFGCSLAPHFDLPFLSTSLREFWGRRWNLYAGGLLKQSVFEPVMQADALLHNRRLRQAVAVCLTFIASGLAHEAVIAYILGPEACLGLELAFFAAMGPLCVLEGWVARWNRITGKVEVPWLLRIAYTWSILYTLSPLFLEGFKIWGLERKTVNAFARLFGFRERMPAIAWTAAGSTVPDL